jgi:HPt (histidine-containing phosphotransfer) domain-containing protein
MPLVSLNSSLAPVLTIFKRMVELDSKIFKGKAYGLFFNEFHQRIQKAEELIIDGVKEDALKDLSNSFHKLKGAAGFFGLEPIYKIASELEIIFLNQKSLDGQDLMRVMEFIKELKSFQVKLPNPN